jgi:hypothetical protein
MFDYSGKQSPLILALVDSRIVAKNDPQNTTDIADFVVFPSCHNFMTSFFYHAAEC